MKRFGVLMVALACLVGGPGGVLAQGPTPPTPEKKPAQARPPVSLSAAGTVKSARHDSLVVTGKLSGGRLTEWVFSLDSRTKIRKAGKDITAGDIAAGDAVHVRYHGEGGSDVADVVLVRPTRKK